MLSEVASGYQVSRSSNEGQLADTQTRSFRVMLNSPGEGFDIQSYCGVYIGDPHPVNTNVFCTSLDTRFDGDSRMVLICTFQYASEASQGNSSGGGGGNSQSPDVRLANWTIGSALYEIPIWNWRERTGQNSWGAGKRAANGANDMYDGVSALDALVTISISQFEMTDPGRHARHVGAINENQFTLGSLVMQPHTVMLRGIGSQPKVESWGPQLWSGWTCTYEFAYKENLYDITVGADTANNIIPVALGWDIAVPQTGFNVRAFAPPGRDIDDPFGQPLRHKDSRIELDNGGPFLPIGMTAEKRARAMVKVFSYEDGGVSQLPSAQPIAINDNGRPRADNLPPIVRGYQVHREINFGTVLGLRTGAA
jgi:hypothetical protein